MRKRASTPCRATRSRFMEDAASTKRDKLVIRVLPDTGMRSASS